MVVDPSSITGNHAEESLPPPRFDARAAASAQPVEPIQSDGEVVHHQRIQGWVQSVRWLSNRLGGQSRVLAIVIVLGLITGTLGGLLLVNAARRGEQPTVNETAVNEASLDISESDAEKLDAFAAGMGGAALQVSPSKSRTRKNKTAWRSTRPRAYRVAVLR